MTLEEAKRIVSKPKFGDPQCLEAKRILDDEARAEILRPKLIGKMLDCIFCSYRGDKDCPMCKGAGKHVISKQLADSWYIDILEQVAEEIGLRS